MNSKDYNVDAFAALVYSNGLTINHIYHFLDSDKNLFCLNSENKIKKNKADTESLFIGVINYIDTEEYKNIIVNYIKKEDIKKLNEEDKAIIMSDLLMSSKQESNLSIIEKLFECGFSLKDSGDLNSINIDFALSGYLDYFKCAIKYNSIDLSLKYKDLINNKSYTITEYMNELGNFDKKTYDFIENSIFRSELINSLGDNFVIKKQPKI